MFGYPDSFNIFFKDSRRCVIPVSGYFEWDKNKKKHYIHSSDDKMLYLAAICKKIDGIVIKPGEEFSFWNSLPLHPDFLLQDQ